MVGGYAMSGRGPRWGRLAGGLLALVLYAPWLAYQRLYDPPGDRLLKWHLAGVTEVEVTMTAETRGELREDFRRQVATLGTISTVSSF